MRALAAFLLFLPLSAAPAQQPKPQATTAAEAPGRDTSYIDAQGRAHVTRVVPVPENLSPQARKMVAQRVQDANYPQTLTQRRQGTDMWQAAAGLATRKVYPANVAPGRMGGVPVRIVTPVSGMRRGYVLMNLHGGGFNSDSGSLTETIPMANLTRMKVVAVLYRLAPEHPFPAGLDDAVAVYRELLKSYRPSHIGIYGTSAGAIMTGEIAVKLKRMGLPEPGALGIFSGFGDFSRPGDSQALFALDGLSGYLAAPKAGPLNPGYVGKTNPRDPVLSPVFADLRGLPPTLFVSSERDMLLSGTSILDRAFLRARDQTQLIVFEGLPHAFWNDASLPESREADGYMAEWFERHLGR